MDGGYIRSVRPDTAAPIRLLIVHMQTHAHSHTHTHTHKHLAYLYARVSALVYPRNALIFIIQTTVFSQIA